MRTVLLAAGLALVAPAVAAQETSSAAPESVTEAEFLAAVAADPVAMQSLEDIEADAAALRRSAGLLANPGFGLERESPGEADQTTAVLSWRLPLDGRRGLEIAAAEAAVEAATARRAAAALELQLQWRGIFAEWAIAEERLRLVEGEAARLEELARQSDERARRGEDSGLTARRFRFAAAELAAQHARARAAAAVARAAAAAQWKGAASRRPLLPSAPAVSPDPSGNPVLAALRADRVRAEREERRAGRFLAFPELFAGWQWQEAPGAEADGLVAGLQWELPLFDRGQAERMRATRAAVAGRAREEMYGRRLEADRASRLAAYDVLRSAAQAGEELHASADATVDAAAAAYGAGESSMTDFLDTIRSVLAARLAALDLHAATLEAHRELERAAGGPLAR